jgi:hypothetical protein
MSYDVSFGNHRPQMPSPTFKLEEQLADQRSDQIAYKLTVENTDTCALRLLSVVPRIPAGSNLLATTNTSVAEASARKAALVEELNLLLKQYLLVVSESFRQAWVERQRAAMKEIFSFTSFLQFYFHLLFNQSNLQARVKRELESAAYKITSGPDARSAYQRWMANSSDHEAIRTLFDAKTEQLERVETLMGEGDRPGLTTIEAGAYFTATYVIRFTRGILEPKKYQVGFDATYQPIEASAPQSISTATNVQISPYPFSLTIIAIAAAVLGVLIKVSLAGSVDPLSDLLKLGKSGQLLVGPIVALIFFNIYEYTSLGKGLGMSVNWRSALLIGALCGIGQDRVLAALKALIGITA